VGVLRSRCWALIVASAVLTSVPRPSAAATFAVEDHAQLGTKIVRLEGDIVQGDEDRLRKVLISLKGTVLTEVFVALDSRGGKRREGVAMARLIRKTGMGTVVLPGARCASACMLVFFGGYDLRSKKPRRIAFQGARLGVHRSTLDLSPEEAKAELKADLIKILSAMQRSVGDMLLELNELDVSLEVQRRILTTDNTSMHYLTDAEKKGSQITVVSGRPGRWSVDSTDLPVTALPSGLWSILAAAQRDGATPSSRAGAPVTQPMASLRRAAGDVRELDLSVTASLGCIVASAREANLRAELCPDRDGLAFSPLFPGRHFRIICRLATGVHRVELGRVPRRERPGRSVETARHERQHDMGESRHKPMAEADIRLGTATRNPSRSRCCRAHASAPARFGRRAVDGRSGAASEREPLGRFPAKWIRFAVENAAQNERELIP
jgi:hypothetical protein